MENKTLKLLTNTETIRELKILFQKFPKVFQKLEIIELYLSTSTNEEFIHSYTLLQKNSSLDYKKIKLSRAQSIINSFLTGSQKSGYIQPIGKELFLKTFLKRYPSPQFLHLGEKTWTSSLLTEYIQLKYFCTITPDSIRKALASLKKYLKTLPASLDLIYLKYLRKKIDNKASYNFIYFYQLHYAYYPLTKNNGSTFNYSRKNTFVGCIYGKGQDNQTVAYRRKPYFQYSYNDLNQIINLNYYFNIPINSGLILLPETLDTKKIVKDWYFWYFSQDKTPPKYHLFFIPENGYSLLDLDDFNDFHSLMLRPMKNCGIKYFKKILSANVCNYFFSGYISYSQNSSLNNEPKTFKKIPPT